MTLLVYNDALADLVDRWNALDLSPTLAAEHGKLFALEASAQSDRATFMASGRYQAESLALDMEAELAVTCKRPGGGQGRLPLPSVKKPRNGGDRGFFESLRGLVIVRENYHTNVHSISPFEKKIRSMKSLWLFQDFWQLCKKSWY